MDKEGPLHVLPAELDRLANSILGNQSIEEGQKSEDKKSDEFVEAIFIIRIVIPTGESMEVQIGGSDMVQELYHVLLERDSTCHRTCFKIYYEDKPLDHFIEIRNIPNIKSRSVFFVIEAITCMDEVKRARPLDVKDEINCLPSEHLLPGAKDIYLESVIPVSSEKKCCLLKNIAFSLFNPPPGPRKMKGDILYLYVDTIENRRFEITCCINGFFVNSTDGDTFNPEPSSTHCRGMIFHSLFDLISELSPQFRKAFPQFLKLRSERHVYERLPTPFQVFSWLVPPVEHVKDHIRADDYSQPHRIGLEDHVPGQVRDWNEELQTTHDMPRDSLSERLSRDRAKFKVYSDFLTAAIRGAINIVEGSIPALNTMDDPKTHMFIWNNIFFSLGFDVKDHYKDVGGDAAAFAAATADLNAVRAYTIVDNNKIHTLGMAIIDYKGLRLTAQSIIPGILERDQEESVVYGSYDSGKTIVGCSDYEEYLKEPAKMLKIAPHRIWNGKKDGKYITLFSSYESKGVTSFPRAFKHKLVTLRQTLLESFAESQPEDVYFNPDCYCDVVKHAPEENIVEQRKLVDRAANFLLDYQIPSFVRDCQNQLAIIVDGCCLVESMHNRGINIRYLGRIIDSLESLSELDYVTCIAKVELLSRSVRHIFREYIQNVHGLSTGCSIAHFLNCLFENREWNGRLTVSHPDVSPASSRKNGKKKRKQARAADSISLVSNINEKMAEEARLLVEEKNRKAMEWRKLSSKVLWKMIADDALNHYGHSITCTNCDEFMKWSGAQPLAVLRRFSFLSGIQLKLRNYFSESETCQKSALFTGDDVYNMFPIVKHVNLRSHDAHSLYLAAINRMLQGFPRMGYELMTQAYNTMNNIYGPLHPNLTLCLRFLARMAFVSGDVSEALTHQYKALMITERCNGFDYYESVLDYINLAHYSFANLHIVSSLKLLYRARHLLLIIHGDAHLIMGQIDANIGIILYSIQEYEMAVKFLSNSLKLYKKYDSSFCLKTAMLYHVMARIYSFHGDFRTALQMEKETFNIYVQLFGQQHDKTKLSGEYLRILTRQAVNFQKKINTANGVGSTQGLIHFGPINVQPPTLQNIIEMLNVFNNFVFLKLEMPLLDSNNVCDDMTNEQLLNKIKTAAEAMIPSDDKKTVAKLGAQKVPNCA